MYRTTNPIQTDKRFRIRPASIIAAASTTALVALGTLWALDIATESPTSPVQATTPQCASEDDTNCFWNAQTQGNGFGESFYTDAEGNTYFREAKAVTETPEYQSVAECAKQLKGFSRDAMALSTELTGYWAQQAAASEDGALSNTTFGEWVVTDNLQPMQDRYDYIVRTFCSE